MSLAYQSSRREWLLLGAGLPFWPFGARDRKIANIRFEVIKHGSSKRRYLHIHGNESTARDLLRQHLKTFKGTGFIVDSDVRNVPVGAVRIDPNRMFSSEGAWRNLGRVNRQAPEAYQQNAVLYLEKDRDKFVKSILPPEGGLLIALHNNGSGYSVNDEIPISDAVSVPDQGNPRDFMLTTQRADFDLIRKSPFNIVLQETSRGEEDGSLSRLCAKRGIRYVNIEAALGNYQQQKQMLEWLEQNLP